MNLQLPNKARVQKFIPKNKFFAKAVVNSKLKDDFTIKIEKITWLYKVSEETVGIPKTKNVEEIQVFEIILKEQVIPKNIITLIDKTIPYPILYRFFYKDHFAFGITYKIDGNFSNFYSEWDYPLEFEFNAKNLEIVYQNIVKEFMHKSEKPQFEEAFEDDKQIKILEKNITNLKNRIKLETQFKNKVDLNEELTKLKLQYNKLLN
ncbi:MAG: DUF4391 domain-containing protein [Candidatus Dojkabacteria bacterium]|nr:MAG: DUF4391 domain-containing protein [Candidatus Dojkabacteria bacterium]